LAGRALSDRLGLQVGSSAWIVDGDQLCGHSFRGIGSVNEKEALLELNRSGGRCWGIAESDEYDIRIVGVAVKLISRWWGKSEIAGRSFD
jgi:hypothetical protein